MFAPLSRVSRLLLLVLLVGGAGTVAASSGASAYAQEFSDGSDGSHGSHGSHGVHLHQDPPEMGKRLAKMNPPAVAASGDSLPPAWCGQEVTADRPTLDSQQGRPVTKVIYAYPRDLPGRFGYFSSLLSANLTHITGFVSAQSQGRKTLRFDMGTECGPQYLDIQALPLRGNRDDYLYGPTEAYPNDRWPCLCQEKMWAEVQEAIGEQIQNRNPNLPLRNFLIYIDGLNTQLTRGQDGQWKRITQNWDWGAAGVYDDDNPDPAKQRNVNAHGQIAAVFGSDPAAWASGLPVADPRQGWMPAMALHELFHTLGAVQNSAPNSTGYYHCNDGLDLMCYRDSTQAKSTQRSVCPSTGDPRFPDQIDCGADDYWAVAPAPGSYLASHWNSYNSPFLADCASEPGACDWAKLPQEEQETDEKTPEPERLTARLRAPRRFSRRLHVSLSVSGPSSQVRFVLGRRVVRTVKGSAAARTTRFSYRPKRLRAGRHRLQARVYSAGKLALTLKRRVTYRPAR